VLGPSLAAPFMAAGSEGTAFLVNGVSFLFVIAGLMIARTHYKIPYEMEARKSLAVEFRDGLAYIRTNALVASIILMAALIGFFGFPLVQQIPALARDVLKTASDTETVVAARTGQLYIAQGVGAMVAAFLAAYLNSARNKGLMVTLGQIAFILPLILLGYVTSLNVSLVLLVLIGWGTVTQLVAMNTLIQVMVPNGLRGRVFSVYLWGLQGVAPFGSLLIGWLAQNWGVPFAALIGGFISLITISGLHLSNPLVRRAQA
jgi:hypothetical protein